MQNRLYFGDNLEILQRHVKEESVDLIYLDPPFNSKKDYNVLFQEHGGEPSEAQAFAFEDTWKWDSAAAKAFEEICTAGGKVADAMVAFRGLLGPSDMLAYLSMMAPRLVMLRRVLKQTGSIYLHCDPTASHYLKVLMDAIFGAKNCRREIIWRSGWVSGFKSATVNWVRNHDVILYYVKDINSDYCFNKELAYRPHAADYKRRGGGENPKGVAIDDVWDEVELYSPWIKSFSTEKLGYMTQKPVTLLERIIKISSKEGDLVLDPFCGCGTTVHAAQILKRPWIGIDITHLAIAMIKHRLHSAFGAKATYSVVGEPSTLADAGTLATSDRYQFQYWALGLVGARPAASEEKKGADRGIDGKLYFFDEGSNPVPKTILISVKSGGVSVKDVRDLRGVIEREKVAIGVLITLEPETKPMRVEAAESGSYLSPISGRKYPKIQILTVEELLAGKRIDYPPFSGATFFTAQPEKARPSETLLPEFTSPAAAEGDQDDGEPEPLDEPLPAPAPAAASAERRRPKKRK